MMKLIPNFIASRFAAKPADAEPTTKLPAEGVWSESSMYAGASFPKYNPDALMTRKGFAIYQRMMLDEQVKAVVRFKRDAITSRDYTFECTHADLSEEERKARCALFEEALRQMKMPMVDALNGILSSMYNGFSMTEKILSHFTWDNRTWIGVERMKLRPADSFRFHTDVFGNVERVVQFMGGAQHDIDIAAMIHFVQNPELDAHYGRSELRECYRAWFSKDMVIKFQNIHLERFAAGFVWAAPKEGKSLIVNSPEFNALKTVMSTLQATSSIILPSGIELNIEHPATTDAFEKAIAQHDKSIAKCLLVPNLMGISEQGSTGSFAQSQTQLEAFLWTLEADATRLEEALNNQLFNQLGELNFGDGMYPQFKFKPISDTRKLEVVRLWKDLVTGGAVQVTEADERYIRDALEMPQKPVIESNAPDLVLNDAQVQALVGIVSQVGAGTLSPEAAKAIITAVFPISEEQASAMVGGAIVEPVEEEAPVVPPIIDPNAKPEDNLPEETVAGKGMITVSAFTKAMKRVDFAVIGTKAAISTEEHSYAIAALNSDVVARLMLQAEELKLGTFDGNPDDIEKIRFQADEMSALKGAVTRALSSAWDIGESHARREVAKARKEKFAVNDMALQDVAASYFKTKAYTLAGDISAATQKTIRNILMEGIKVSKTFAETKQAVYKALERDGLITEEDVVDALGASTVKAANARIATAIQTVSFEAINEARYQLFSDPELDGFVEALEYSAILDDRTTEICTQLNGQTYGIDDEVWSSFRPPNHFNCRSILVPVTILDTWSPSDAPTVNPQKGFGFRRTTFNQKVLRLSWSADKGQHKCSHSHGSKS